MAELKLFWVLCVFGIWAVASGGSHSHAPSPSVDCSSVLLSMADCLTFVMNGSTISKPKGSCCSGFKIVLKENPMCLCQSFNNNNNMGIALNMTKATTLPAACGVPTLPFSKCGISIAPVAAPVPSPSPKSSKLPSAAARSTSSTETTTPMPSLSGAAPISISVALVASSLALVALNYS